MKKFFLLLLVITGAAAAQTEGIASEPHQSRLQEMGSPYLQNFRPKEYGQGAQNWSMVQDQRGVMYFGNNKGVLEYDGVSWRLIQVTNRSAVRSLAAGNDGKIYVGARGEFGYLAPDFAGRLQYVSLRDSVPAAYRDFADIAKTYATSAGVYFQALDRLFLWAPPRLRVWKPATPFHLSFAVRDRFYIRQPGIGLMQMVGDSLQSVPDGEKFAQLRIYFMLPFDGNKILIGTREQGQFLYDGASAKPWPTEAEAFLLENQIYHGAVLTDKCFAVATVRGGAAIIDPEGRLQQIIDKAAGMQDNDVKFVFPDRQNGLWLALNNGLTRVETPSPLSIYNERAGLKGGVESILRHRGTLYVTTGQGVFYLQPRSPAEFKPVANIAAESWFLLSAGKTLLAAISDGVYGIQNGQAMLIRKSEGHSFALLRSPMDTNRVYIGLKDGLASIRAAGPKWIDEGRINGIDEEIRSIAETKEGILWLGTRTQGYVRVDFSEGFRVNPKIEKYDRGHGLPEDHGWVTVIAMAGGEVFVTERDFFRFDANADRFIPDSTFGRAYASGSPTIGEVATDRHDNVWLQAVNKNKNEIGVAKRQADGSYVWQHIPFNRFSDFIVWAIDPEETGVIWFGGPDGLIRYNANVPKDYAAPFAALIRRVKTVGSDSLIFAGANGLAVAPKLAYASNALRFEYAAANYDETSANQFQYFLEGFDKGWSEWTNENKKDYTNLPKGEYRFHVRAKNIYEHESEAAVYPFAILPPWWRTWWAYSLYALGLIAGLFAVDRLQRQRLLKKERERAQLREAELRAQTAEAQAQAAEAQALALRAENERKKNVELLSEIGKEITASLDSDTIFYKLYEHVNQLAEAAIFGVGIYHPEKRQIEYRLAIERGKRCAPYTRDFSDKNQFAVWCIENRRAVFINEVAQEYRRYISAYDDSGRQLEDGTFSEAPQSLIYLPLPAHDRVLGVITIQSFQKHAYTEYHLNLLQNLATYTTIALDNADAYRQLHATLEHLKATQQQLVTQEKLASLGQLTAGIAHEIKNPLNFVNNFAVLSVDLAKELREEIEKRKAKGDGSNDFADIEEIIATLIQNAEKINHHGKRADGIVRSMMLHARGVSGQQERTDINYLLDESVNLVYHGFRAQEAAFNVTIEKAFDESIGPIEVVPQEMSRVFLNLVNNACYAAHQRKKENRKRQKENGDNFSPVLSVRTKNLGDKIEIRIRDNGNGIPPDIRDKIFNPFFTTKPAGQGTGLGLSISYDIIVQQHRGELRVETEEGKFTEFIISLPRRA